jgi:hypothetical protein
MSRAILAAALLAASVAACADKPTDPERPGPEPKPAPLPLGLYEITITGADGSDAATAQARLVPSSTTPSQALNPAAAGLAFEQVTVTTFVEGSRTTGGQRFVTATFRVRNQTGAPLTNLTLIPVSRNVAPTTKPNSPFSSLLRFDGSAVPDSVATYMMPTGAVSLGDDGKIRSPYPDVLQVFEEAEVSAIALPAGTTNIFPYGFVVRNATNPATRAIPVAANANDWTGLFTWSFRYPLQPTASGDPYTIGFQFLAVQDTEVRMTESVEERQDTSGVRRARERATALGATTVTVLAGSQAADPFVTDYPGQRQICLVRTAGTSGSPVRRIMYPGYSTELMIYRPGETTNNCQAYFRSGTALPANYGLTYTVAVWSMDRYGNGRTVPADTVTLTSTDGTAVMPAPKALTAATANMNITYTTYGNSTLQARGRRVRGETPVFMNGMTRTWTGNVDTNWLSNGDWAQLFHPGVQDSVVIPGDRPNYPLLVANTTTGGVTMTNGAGVNPFINLSSFDLTINGDLQMGTLGTFTGTGRVILAGASNTIGGGLTNVDMRNLRVTGRYSTTSNINVTGGRIVVQGGRLRSQGYRVRVRPS